MEKKDYQSIYKGREMDERWGLAGTALQGARFRDELLPVDGNKIVTLPDVPTSQELTDEVNRAKAKEQSLEEIVEQKIQRVELVFNESTKTITLMGETTPLTHDEISDLIADRTHFVTLLDSDGEYLLPQYLDGAAIIFTGLNIFSYGTWAHRVAINNENIVKDDFYEVARKEDLGDYYTKEEIDDKIPAIVHIPYLSSSSTHDVLEDCFNKMQNAPEGAIFVMDVDNGYFVLTDVSINGGKVSFSRVVIEETDGRMYLYELDNYDDEYNLMVYDETIATLYEVQERMVGVYGDIGNLSRLKTENRDSLVDAVNEVLSDIPDVSDFATKSELTTLQSKVGNLSTLETEAKDNLVNAINEVKQQGGGGSDFEELTPIEFDGNAKNLTIVEDVSKYSRILILNKINQAPTSLSSGYVTIGIYGQNFADILNINTGKGWYGYDIEISPSLLVGMITYRTQADSWLFSGVQNKTYAPHNVPLNGAPLVFRCNMVSWNNAMSIRVFAKRR